MKLFSSKEQSKIVLIADVGSGSIGASLVEISTKNKPKVLFSTRESIKYRSSIDDAPRLLSLIANALDEVLLKVKKDGFKHLNFNGKRKKGVSEVVAVLSSPWYQATTLEITLQKEEPYIVKPAFAIEAIRRNEKNFLETLPESSTGSYFFSDEHAILEHAIMRNRLNGYDVEDPFGRKAKEFSFLLFTSASSKKLLESLRDKFESHFSIPVKFHAFSLSAITSMHKIRPESSTYCFIDVAGSGSEVMIVKDGHLVANAYMDFGRHTLLSLLKKTLPDTPPQVAIDTIKQHFEHLKSGIAPMTQKIAEEFVKSWDRAFKETLLTLDVKHFLPSTFYVTSDHDLTTIITKLISDSALLKERLPAAGQIEAVAITKEQIEALAEMPGMQEDPFLAIESFFASEISFARKKADSALNL